MRIQDIIFSQSHWISPFTTQNGIYLSTIEKIVSIALSILTGIVTVGVGGVIVFYLVTAAIKAGKLNEMKPSSKLIASTSKEENYTHPIEKEAKAQVFDSNKIIRDVNVSNSHTSNTAASSHSIDFQKFFKSQEITFYPPSIQERRHPPLGPYDTVIIRNGRIDSVHPEGVKFYNDSEIHQLHSSIERIDLGKNRLGNNLHAEIIDNGKVVIQQQATRACTAAVAAMLIYDAKKSINLNSLHSTNLGNTDSIKRWITAAGLIPRVNILTFEDDKSNELISNLRRLIMNYGSAIVSTNNDIGGHVIVVDAVSDNLKYIRLRDPYHGWAITVTKEAFLRGFNGGDVIQLG